MEREIFYLSGPSHLTAVDWKNPYHRRSVAASLVQGVNILERDRQQNRQGHQAHAFPWWKFFHFQLISPLIDDVDYSIFGAIYEFNSFTSDHNTPKYVIAFRGTVKKVDSIVRDMMLDLQSILGTLHQSSRFQRAMDTVQGIVATVGAANIWLAGHSLGSAIALLIGKNLTRMGCPIETYLFNPPFISAPIKCISNPKVRHGIRYVSSFIKGGFADQSSQNNDSFFLLSGWAPYLFVNPNDHICSGYIDYFEHRKRMEKIGATKIERLATQNSMLSMIIGALGMDSEPLHLLPSASLTINRSHTKRAHGIHQWWDPRFHGQSELHLLR